MNVIMAYHRPTQVRVPLDHFVPRRLAAKQAKESYRKFDITASLHGGTAQPLHGNDAGRGFVDADGGAIDPAAPTAIFIEANYGEAANSDDLCSDFVIAMLERYPNVPMVCVFSTTVSALAAAEHAIAAYILIRNLNTTLIANDGSVSAIKLAIERL